MSVGGDSYQEAIDPAKQVRRSLKLAKYYGHKSQPEKALTEFVRAVAYSELLEPRGGGKGEGVVLLQATCYCHMAEAYLNIKHYPVQALRHAEHSLSLLESHSSADDTHKCLVHSLFITATSSLLMHKYARAKQDFSRCLHVLKRKDLSSSGQHKFRLVEVKTLLGLAKVYSEQKKVDAAVEYGKRALDLAELEVGSGEEKIEILMLLAKMEVDAEGKTRFLEDARAVALELYGECSERVVNINLHLAKAHLARGSLEGVESGEEVLTSCLAAVRRENEGGAHDRLLTPLLDELAKVYVKNEKFEEGKDLLVECVEVRRRVDGEVSCPLADTLKLLASVCLVLGQLDLALSSLEKCLDMECVMLGRQHRVTQATLSMLSLLSKNPEAGDLKTLLQLSGKPLVDKPFLTSGRQIRRK